MQNMSRGIQRKYTERQLVGRQSFEKGLHDPAGEYKEQHGAAEFTPEPGKCLMPCCNDAGDADCQMNKIVERIDHDQVEQVVRSNAFVMDWIEELNRENA